MDYEQLIMRVKKKISERKERRCGHRAEPREWVARRLLPSTTSDKVYNFIIKLSFPRDVLLQLLDFTGCHIFKLIAHRTWQEPNQIKIAFRCWWRCFHFNVEGNQDCISLAVCYWYWNLCHPLNHTDAKRKQFANEPLCTLVLSEAPINQKALDGFYPSTKKGS